MHVPSITGIIQVKNCAIEPLYSNSMVITGCLLSRRAQNIPFLRTWLLKIFTLERILCLLLSRIFTSDPNPTALSDVYRLFTTIVYISIQVACFDAIFDCITNMIGRLFNLHIVKPNMEKTGFLDLYSAVNVTF